MSGHESNGGGDMHLMEFSREIVTPETNLFMDAATLPLTGGLLGILFMHLPDTGASMYSSGKSAGGGHGGGHH
jgi:hypothetical protein